MGVEWELVCYKHRESLPLGKLRETYDMVNYFSSCPSHDLPKYLLKIPKHLLKNQRFFLYDIFKFRKRHKGCKPQLINDHMDLEASLFIEVDFEKPLPTKEDFIKYAETKAVPLFRGDHIEYFVSDYEAQRLGAKVRKVKIKFLRHVKGEIVEYPGFDEEMVKMDMSYDVYEGENGQIYHVNSQNGGVSVEQTTSQSQKDRVTPVRSLTTQGMGGEKNQ